MLQALRRHMERDEGGFTLIELMVVVLIIAILLAIAIPTFLGARVRAQDRAAQSTLRNTLTAEKAFYTDAQAYSAVATELKAIEPAINYQAQTNTIVLLAVANQVGVATDTGVSTTAKVVCITAHSASGKDFEIMDEASGGNPGTYYFGTSTAAAAGACTAALAETGKLGSF